MSDWVQTLDKNGFIESSYPNSVGWVEGKLEWFDDSDKTVTVDIYFDGVTFRADKFTDIAYEWNVCAWRNKFNKAKQ